ncbi:MAG: aspartate aminotransferase family protein [Acidimicrobiales bacterium]|nr:aspartate aminotransferase family protein [Acidimicrobiales bacterium]
MYPDASSRSAELYERARRVLPDGVSRGTVLVNPYPIYVASGAGAWVTDVDGNRYLDANNNYTAIILGHAHPTVIDAVASQLSRGSAFSFATEAEVALAELLCARVPHFERIRFCNSGTEAVMTAVKAARAFTGRPLIAKIEGGYHGAYDHVEVSLDAGPDTWGPASAPTGVPYAAGVPDSVLAETVVLPFNDAAAATALIEAHGERLAAVLLDTLPSRVGMPAPDPAFLDAIWTSARKAGALIVADEVISFRLGPAGNLHRLGRTPDLTALAKIIGGGFPVGAVAGRSEVMDVFAALDGARPRVPAGGTFSANSVTMVAGRACLELLDAAAFERLATMGERVRRGFRAMFDQLSQPGQVTGDGSLFRLHPHDRPLRGYRDARPQGEESAMMGRVHRELLNRGVYLTTYGMGCLSLAMTDEDLDHLLDAGQAAFAAARAAGRGSGAGR